MGNYYILKGGHRWQKMTRFRLVKKNLVILGPLGGNYYILKEGHTWQKKWHVSD